MPMPKDVYDAKLAADRALSEWHAAHRRTEIPGTYKHLGSGPLAAEAQRRWAILRHAECVYERLYREWKEKEPLSEPGDGCAPILVAGLVLAATVATAILA